MNKDGINSQALWGALVLIFGPIAARWGIDDEMFQALGQVVTILVGVAQVGYGRQRAGNPITTIARIPVPQVLIPQQEQPK